MLYIVSSSPGDECYSRRLTDKDLFVVQRFYNYKHTACMVTKIKTSKYSAIQNMLI